jgi:hypothetical protein
MRRPLLIAVLVAGVVGGYGSAIGRASRAHGHGGCEKRWSGQQSQTYVAPSPYVSSTARAEAKAAEELATVRADLATLKEQLAAKTTVAPANASSANATTEAVLQLQAQMQVQAQALQMAQAQVQALTQALAQVQAKALTTP